jgi:hypothetical protein
VTRCFEAVGAGFRISWPGRQCPSASMCRSFSFQGKKAGGPAAGFGAEAFFRADREVRIFAKKNRPLAREGLPAALRARLRLSGRFAPLTAAPRPP